MDSQFDDSLVRTLGLGLSQKGVRNHNERLLLSLLQRQGDQPASELARLSALSPPTVSAILRRLETDGLIQRGAPTRGKVGKPSVPMALAPNGVLSFGLKIGRRSAELLLIDMTGAVRAQRLLEYAQPVPADVFDFLSSCISDICGGLSADHFNRICGIGVAAPFELWNSHDRSDESARGFEAWRGISIPKQIEAFSALPVYLANDATSACQAEHVFGRGKNFRDYAYFFIGAYAGGGVVLNHSVYVGRQGNAGALGSLPSISPLGESMQLVDMASIHLLEKRLREVDIDPKIIWHQPQDWTGIARHVDQWLGQTAQQLAKASLAVCSVIDFEAILFDGAFPAEVRHDLVERIGRYIANQDVRGLIPPRIEAGAVGGNARAIGAAATPMLAQFLLDTNAAV